MKRIRRMLDPRANLYRHIGSQLNTARQLFLGVRRLEPLAANHKALAVAVAVRPSIRLIRLIRQKPSFLMPHPPR